MPSLCDQPGFRLAGHRAGRPAPLLPKTGRGVAGAARTAAVGDGRHLRRRNSPRPARAARPHGRMAGSVAGRSHPRFLRDPHGDAAGAMAAPTRPSDQEPAVAGDPSGAVAAGPSGLGRLGRMGVARRHGRDLVDRRRGGPIPLRLRTIGVGAGAGVRPARRRPMPAQYSAHCRRPRALPCWYCEVGRGASCCWRRSPSWRPCPSSHPSSIRFGGYTRSGRSPRTCRCSSEHGSYAAACGQPRLTQ